MRKWANVIRIIVDKNIHICFCIYIINVFSKILIFFSLICMARIEMKRPIRQLEIWLTE